MTRSCAGTSGGRDPAACTANSSDTVAAALNRSLARDAATPDYLAARRAPLLERESDGTYRYRGRLYRARIDHDGTVRFVDRVAGRKHPRRERELDSAEKRWFLAETEALRSQLADGEHVREQMKARRALELELERIIGRGDDAALVHEQILRLWQDCGTDAESPRARAIVEGFVRTRLPRASRLGFQDSELEAFNRARPAAQTFNPYL